MKYLKLLRVKHYLKNVIVLFPLFFSRRFLDNSYWLSAMLGFSAFCAISSAVYIFNDIRDVEDDRRHEYKQFRPLASGAIKVSSAWGIFSILIFGAIILQGPIQGSYIDGILYILGYFIINICYSAGLKNIPIVDVSLLSLGYVIRLMYGSVTFDIPISAWLFLAILMISFYLSIGKREFELEKSIHSKIITRKVLEAYSLEFLKLFKFVFLSLFLVFYSLWAVNDFVDISVIGLFLVIVICMRYEFTTQTIHLGDPIEVIFKDKLLCLLALIYGIFMGIFLILG